MLLVASIPYSLSAGSSSQYQRPTTAPSRSLRQAPFDSAQGRQGRRGSDYPFSLSFGERRSVWICWSRALKRGRSSARRPKRVRK